MNQSLKAVITFIIIIGVVFAAVLYKYGIPSFGRAEIVSSSSSNTVSTTTTAASSASGSVSFNVSVSGVLGYVARIGDVVKSVIEWIINSVRSSDISTTIIKGIVMTTVFIIIGYLINIVSKFIRFIFYGLGVITAVITMLIVLGIL